MPELLTTFGFWKGWLEQIEYMVGYIALVGALFGLLLFRPGLPRAMMAGLWGGYLVFGLVFARHVHTHDYYSLQLVPVVALSLGQYGIFLQVTCGGQRQLTTYERPFSGSSCWRWLLAWSSTGRLSFS